MSNRGDERPGGARELAPDEAVSAEMAADPTLDELPIQLGEVTLEELRTTDFGDRYRLRSTLGRGGTAEIRLYRDTRIGRDVALKAYGTSSVRSSAEVFVREARVQARLEHPAIVPVYEMGEAGGWPYFTMKRVSGWTLAQILFQLRSGDEEMRERFPKHRLLNALVRVCEAIEFAHGQGVIHRDLKPSNIMLGQYGEVYVLDWGCAKLASVGRDVQDVEDGALPFSRFRPRKKRPLLGTVGYMPPEQIEAPDSVTETGDVYPLGVILFEILTEQRLISSCELPSMIERTLEGPDARPSVRLEAGDVPPELEAACVRACAREPTERFSGPGELGRAVEAYLRGDRDLALRRKQAQDYVRQAEEAADVALTGSPGADAHRVRSLRLVGRALALDPEHQAGLRTLTRLLSHPPTDLPSEVEGTMTTHSRRQMRLGGAAGGISFPIVAAIAAASGLAGVREPLWYATALVLLVVASALGWITFSRFDPPRGLLYGMMVAALLGMATLARYWSPWIVVPGILSAMGVAFCMMWGWRHRIIVMTISVTGFLATVAADLLGLWPSTYYFDDGVLHVLGGMVELLPVPTTVVFLLSSVGTIIIPALIVGFLRQQSLTMERQLHLQTWQLRQLAPDSDGRSDRGHHGSEESAGAGDPAELAEPSL